MSDKTTRVICPECNGTRMFQGPGASPIYIIGGKLRSAQPCAMCFGSGTIIVRESPSGNNVTK